MRERHRRDNYLAFWSLPWAQEVRGSNPRAPTKFLKLSELEEVNFGGAAWWCNSGTIRKIPKLSAPETCRKHMQTLNTERACCVSGRRTVGAFRRAKCSRWQGRTHLFGV